MQRAHVFGEPALAQFILLSLHGTIRAELCMKPDITDEASVVVLADRGWESATLRAESLAALAGAAARGIPALALSSEAEAVRWLRAQAAGVPGRRSLERIAILGESGVGKTVLANKLAPALGLPLISLDSELWWREDRARNFRHRTRQVEARSEDARWIAEGVYLWLALPFARRATLTIHLDLPADIARRQREGRGPATGQPPHARLLVGAMRAAYPPVTARLARRELSRIAHHAPVLRIRTEEERDAVTAALLRAALPADAPPSTG